MGKTFIGILLIVAVLGMVGGFVLSKNTTQKSSSSAALSSSKMVKTSKEVGSMDKSFSDTAVGVLKTGGLNGEGTHRLERDGGPSQTVYLISSVVDLSEFDGKKIELWGQTLKASKVPWLMDVGRVKLVE